MISKPGLDILQGLEHMSLKKWGILSLLPLHGDQFKVASKVSCIESADRKAISESRHRCLKV